MTRNTQYSHVGPRMLKPPAGHSRNSNAIRRRKVKRSLLSFCASWLLAGSAFAQGTISPSPFLVVFDNAGHIVNNACVWTYVAGTTTAVFTYTDVGLTTTNSNPIRSDSAGRFTAYLTPGSSYKFIYEASCSPPSHGTVYRTADNISATPASTVGIDVLGTAGEALSATQAVYLSDGSGGKTTGQWYKADSTNTYSSTLPIVGAASAAISAASTGTIRIAGSATGFSSLTVGSNYFVSTAGAITTTAPTNRRYLGLADSTSSLILTGNPSIATAISTLTYALLPTGGGTWANGGALTISGGVVTASSGITTGGNLAFTPDATNDIGAAGASRPSNAFISGRIVQGGATTTNAVGTRDSLHRSGDPIAFTNSANTDQATQTTCTDLGSMGDSTAVSLTMFGTSEPLAAILVLVNQPTGNFTASDFILLRGTQHLTGLITNGGNFTTSAGTGSRINVSWSGANSRYELENKTGQTIRPSVCYWRGL